MSSSLRLVFAGSPAAAVPSLATLAGSRHEVAAVITREDSPQGRRGVLTPTPVAVEAEGRGIPVIRANRLAGAATEAVLSRFFVGRVHHHVTVAHDFAL